jgi:tetratricopeptide (TPR) repeat protein
MNTLTPRIVLECILLLLPVGAFGKEAANIPEANVQNAVTYVDRGLAREKKGDLDGAMADFNQAIQLNPGYAAAYNSRGVVRKKKNDLAGAMADYNWAIKLNPKFDFPYNNRGKRAT